MFIPCRVCCGVYHAACAGDCAAQHVWQLLQQGGSQAAAGQVPHIPTGIGGGGGGGGLVVQGVCAPWGGVLVSVRHDGTILASHGGAVRGTVQHI